jgi:hypothetical protein
VVVARHLVWPEQDSEPQRWAAAYPARPGAAKAEARRLPAEAKPELPFPFQAVRAAPAAQAQLVALAQQVAEPRLEEPAARDAPAAEVGRVAEPDGAAVAEQQPAEPADAAVPLAAGAAAQDAAGRRAAAEDLSEAVLSGEVPLAAAWVFRQDQFPPAARLAQRPGTHRHSVRARPDLRGARR